MCKQERDWRRPFNALVASYPLPVGRDCLMESLVEETLVTEVKAQWKRLWRERIDDPVLAEGVASMDFDKLFVERGTVVLATRSFKLITLREILEQHKVANAERHIPPSRHVGGWGKFAHTHLPRYESERRRQGFAVSEDMGKKQQLKKGGRGWLHV